MIDAPPLQVSVIMPVFNAELYLKQAVSSILQQTFRDFEFIIIDDGSTDSSLSILKEFAAADERIRLISRPNTGYTIALNEALSLARGEFIARMDADDISLPRRFELQLEYLRTHPQCVALGTRELMIDPTGREITEFCTLTDHEAIDRAHLKDGASVMGHPTMMMRRAVLQAVGGYRPEREPAEDLDLWLRLAERGKLANLCEVLLKYRMSPRSVSGTRLAEQRAAIAAAVADARHRRGLPDEAMNSHPRPDHPMAWARLALESGRLANARYFSLRAIRRQPFSLLPWTTLARASPGTRQIMAFLTLLRDKWQSHHAVRENA